MPSTLFRCSEQTEGSLGAESAKVLLKSVHTHVCLAVSTDLEEAATTRRLEIWREGEPFRGRGTSAG